MTWAQNWEMEDSKKLKKNFSIIFHNDSANNTAQYDIYVKSNFDFKPDTTGQNNFKVSKLNIHVEDEKHITYKYEIPHLTLADEGFGEHLSIHSDATVFDDEETPYVNFYISFDPQAIDVDSLSETSKIHIFLNNEFKDGFGNMPYEVLDGKPESNTNCPYILSYSGREEVKQILRKGLYVSTINRELKQKKDRESFFYSVIIGALVSFLFSIIINLFTKWRNLNLSEGKSNPYSSN